MAYRQQQGSLGETIALAFLEQQGWRCWYRNFRTRFGEIDLIMHDGASFVAVEVKFRRSERFGSPAEALTATKRRHLAAAIASLMLLHPAMTPMRCDVITLLTKGPRTQLRHLRNVELETGLDER